MQSYTDCSQKVFGHLGPAKGVNSWETPRWYGRIHIVADIKG